MRIRVRPSAVFLLGGLALSGCIDVECPPEFARPASRERYCGHQGYVAMPPTYTQGYRAPVTAQPVRVMTPPPADLPPGPPAAAPVGPPVMVQPVPPPGPTTIR
jgi:hypothetical protein